MPYPISPPHQLSHLLQSGWVFFFWGGGEEYIISYPHITLCNICTLNYIHMLCFVCTLKYVYALCFIHTLLYSLSVCRACRGGEFKLGCHTLSVPPHQLSHLLQSDGVHISPTTGSPTSSMASGMVFFPGKSRIFCFTSWI